MHTAKEPCAGAKEGRSNLSHPAARTSSGSRTSCLFALVAVAVRALVFERFSRGERGALCRTCVSIRCVA